MNRTKNGFLLIIMLAIIGGMEAGIFGEIFTRSYLLGDLYAPYGGQELDLASLNAGRSNLIIRDAKKVIVNQDIKVDETIGSIKPALLGVYRELQESSNLAYYDLDNPLFVALSVTSDGWLMASVSDKVRNSFSSQNYVVISDDRQVYKIDEINFVKDLPGNLVLFHLESVSNLYSNSIYFTNIIKHQ